MRKLGDNQRHLLRMLHDHGEWNNRCGWLWNSQSGTVRILDSLIARGLVREKARIVRTRVVRAYALTAAGRRTVINHATARPADGAL